MTRTRATIVFVPAAIGVMLCIAGCSVSHKFPAQKIATAVPVESRLPLKVAVYADPEFTFGYPRISYLQAFTEVMNPGFADTLHSAFNSDFQAVTVIEKQSASADTDLIASPRLDLSDP